MTVSRRPRAVFVFFAMLAAVAVVIVVAALPSSGRKATLGQIRQAQRQFRRYGVDSYTVDLQRTCFCNSVGLTFTLTVKHGQLVHIVAKGFGPDDPRRDEDADRARAELPPQDEWLYGWGPIGAALASLASEVAAGGTAPGPSAVFADKGAHEVVRTLSYDDGTGVLRSYSSHVTNTFDSQVSYVWSNFRPRNP